MWMVFDLGAGNGRAFGLMAWTQRVSECLSRVKAERSVWPCERRQTLGWASMFEKRSGFRRLSQLVWKPDSEEVCSSERDGVKRPPARRRHSEVRDSCRVATTHHSIPGSTHDFVKVGTVR